jgi:hypothetical protein
LPRPGKSTADGQHWVYRLDGRRKCWFQAAEGIATVKKPVRHHAAERRVATPAENEAAQLKQESVADARAELLRSPPAETPHPRPPASELKLVDAASVVATGAAAIVPPKLVANLTTDTPVYPALRQVDVETLLAAAPAASDLLLTPCLRPQRSPFLSPMRVMAGRVLRQTGLASC